MRYRYYICDVFTDTRFGGNQLAVLPAADGLSDQQMQQIAREFNFSETTFVLPAEAGHTRRVRIFTPTAEIPFAASSLASALEAFIANTGIMMTAVDDFVSNFGENAQGLSEYLTSLVKSRLPAADYDDGYEATVIAIKANEAILKGQKIAFQKEWFES